MKSFSQFITNEQKKPLPGGRAHAVNVRTHAAISAQTDAMAHHARKLGHKPGSPEGKAAWHKLSFGEKHGRTAPHMEKRGFEYNKETKKWKFVGTEGNK